jgi:fructose/tagatose bisphosphate aldolase|tara:strand:- start:4085 stop:5029 length:945 start_codon:yes stop_codon:yes gene_type:complete
MIYPKYYIGPMSQNIVDAIIEFCDETNNKIGLIPSRRQVEWDGGYVNNWTTEIFSKYTDKLILKRDHSGPGQGYTDDDGFKSLEYDCKYLNMIHIDPWKKYPSYEEGLNWTLKMIKFCYNKNPNIEFEVGTEESIRRFSPTDIDILLTDLKLNLTNKEFNQIKYAVIQSGTSLKETTNTGEYDKYRLTSMIQVVKNHNLLSKEHNGDYIPANLIKEKMKLGLDAINIAPEFGLIETQTYIDNGIDIDKFWKICFNSKRWEKWVSSDFDPYTQKLDLIKICGHYVLSTPEFLKIKPNVDNIIKSNIKNKLNELYR